MSIQPTVGGRLTAEAGKDLDRVLHPGRYYARPADVLADLELTIEERRSILSSWASDACAVESAPALRQPPSAPEPVTFDEIMDALVQLDGLPATPCKKSEAGHRWTRCL